MDWLEEAVGGLEQGEIIPNCLVPFPGDFNPEAEEKERWTIQVRQFDILVLSQACDLAQRKIEHVLICPVIPLSNFFEFWRKKQEATGQGTSRKAWASQLREVREDREVRYGYLGPRSYSFEPFEDGIVHPQPMPLIADFRTLHTVPLTYLEHVLPENRTRLSREYLSHAMQRLQNFLTRVGRND